MLPLMIINTIFMLVLECSSHDLPTYFPRCELDDPDLNFESSQILRPYIRKGIEEINFPSMDPLVISTFKVIQDSASVNFTATAWNYTVRGLDNYDITEIKYDPKTMTFSGKIEYDSISINAGRLLHVPIKSNGVSEGSMANIKGTFEVIGKIRKNKDIDFYNPIETNIRMKIGESYCHFGGVFGGNEDFERMTNNVINQNSDVITHAVTPVFEKLAERGLMYLMKSLTRTIPYEKLFPQSYK